MILYENNPIITDIFIRAQDRKTLSESNNQEEMDALVRRYMTFGLNKLFKILKQNMKKKLEI